MPLNTLWFDRKFLIQYFCRCIQPKCAAGTFPICIDAAADQCIMDINGRIFIIKSCNSSHIILPYYNTGYGFHSNCFAFIRKCDCSIVISCNSSGKACCRFPFMNDHIVNRIIIVRKIACAVCNCRICLIVSYNSADILFVSCCNTLIDAILKCNIRRIFSYDSTNIAVTDHITCIGRYRSTAFCRCLNCIRDASAESSGNSAYILISKYITILLCRTIRKKCVFPISSNSAYISALKKFFLIIAAIAETSRTSQSTDRIIYKCLIAVAYNASKIVSLNSTTCFLCTDIVTKNQTIIIAVQNICFLF